MKYKNRKYTNSSRKKFNICCKILVTGLISTPLYLENGKTNTSVGILYKEHFTRNIKGNNNQICLKNGRKWKFKLILTFLAYNKLYCKRSKVLSNKKVQN
jgi:hypothetical protein